MLNKKTIVTSSIFLSILILSILIFSFDKNMNKQVSNEDYPEVSDYIGEGIIESFMIENSLQYYGLDDGITKNMADIFVEDQEIEKDEVEEDEITNDEVEDDETVKNDIEKDKAEDDSSDEIIEKSMFGDIGISIADNYVNIREEANAQSKILGKLFKASAATILNKENDWYYIESGSVKGYVNSEYIKTKIPDDELIKKYAKQRVSILADGLNLRSEANEESKILAVVYQKEKYPVVKVVDDWVNIELADSNTLGYVKKDYVEIITEFTYALSAKEEELQLKQEEEKKKAKKQAKEEEKKTKETEIVKRQETQGSVDDLALLACLVHSEAGGESYEGKLAVANVVLNRVKSSKYPSTIEKVIYQKGQFSVAASGILKKQLAKYENYTSSSHKSSIKAAKAALDGDNNIGNRLYFNLYKSAVKQGYNKRANSVKIDSQLFW